ncbi:hypothetical protein VTI28DRAFT_3505 [Corynascus sepedonium]
MRARVDPRLEQPLKEGLPGFVMGAADQAVLGQGCRGAGVQRARRHWQPSLQLHWWLLRTSFASPLVTGNVEVLAGMLV